MAMAKNHTIMAYGITAVRLSTRIGQ